LPEYWQKPPTPNKHTLAIGTQAAKIRWEEENTDTTTLKNIINPTHRHAIQEKTKKSLEQEKAQRKKDDKSKKEKRRQQRRRNDTT
jgi:hypothetical protein